LLTKDTNLQIRDRAPSDHFREVQERNPGALASQWIPMDPVLWKEENYLAFLEARKALLAEAANSFLDGLYHGDTTALVTERVPIIGVREAAALVEEAAMAPGGVGTEKEEELLLQLNKWIVEQGLPEGSYLYEFNDPDTGAPLAIFDLAWPSGIQEEYSQPVAVLIDEGPEVKAVANARGFRYFTNIEAFKDYVEQEVLALEATGA